MSWIAIISPLGLIFLLISLRLSAKCLRFNCDFGIQPDLNVFSTFLLILFHSFILHFIISFWLSHIIDLFSHATLFISIVRPGNAVLAQI